MESLYIASLAHTLKQLRLDECVTLLSARLEDYASQDDPMRAIEAFVETLNMPELSFQHTAASSGVGQPP